MLAWQVALAAAAVVIAATAEQARVAAAASAAATSSATAYAFDGTAGLMSDSLRESSQRWAENRRTMDMLQQSLAMQRLGPPQPAPVNRVRVR